jgi:hypothetical protein
MLVHALSFSPIYLVNSHVSNSTAQECLAHFCVGVRMLTMFDTSRLFRTVAELHYSLTVLLMNSYFSCKKFDAVLQDMPMVLSEMVCNAVALIESLD